jgi:hypothetical protein
MKTKAKPKEAITEDPATTIKKLQAKIKKLRGQNKTAWNEHWKMVVERNAAINRAREWENAYWGYKIEMLKVSGEATKAKYDRMVGQWAGDLYTEKDLALSALENQDSQN